MLYWQKLKKGQRSLKLSSISYGIHTGATFLSRSWLRIQGQCIRLRYVGSGVKQSDQKISQEFWSKVLMLKECRTNIPNFRPDFRFSSSWFPWQVWTRVLLLTNFRFVATDLQNLLFEKYLLSSELHNIICGCREDYICTTGSLFCAKIIIKCSFVPVFSLNISLR